jgi:hypothetical protein
MSHVVVSPTMATPMNSVNLDQSRVPLPPPNVYRWFKRKLTTIPTMYPRTTDTE